MPDGIDWNKPPSVSGLSEKAVPLQTWGGPEGSQILW